MSTKYKQLAQSEIIIPPAMNQINQPDKWRKNTLLFLNTQFLQAQSFHTSGSPDDKRIISIDGHEDQLIEERTMSCSSLPDPLGIPQPKRCFWLLSQQCNTMSKAISLFQKDPKLFMVLQMRSDPLLHREEV